MGKKIVYRIYQISEKTICTPSDNFYAKENDWYSETINVLELKSEDFDTFELALEAAESFTTEVTILTCVI